MIWLLLWNADNSTFSENIRANAVFSYLWKPRFWHYLQHEVHVSYREETQNVILLHNGKPASNEIPHFSHSVYKTQCAEMQLIEYSTQKNYLAAPLKCRQLHVQREHQCQSSFSYLSNPGFWQHLQHKVNVSYREKTQCAEMQLIEYSAQSNDLAAPLTYRQLHIQREP